MWRSRKRGRIVRVGADGKLALPLAAVSLCALWLSGCAQCGLPQIDPTGERIFARDAPALSAEPPRYRDEPGGPLPWDDVAVTLAPRATVASIGSEVVLAAGVVGPDNYFRTNRRLEWSLAQGSVGSFVDVGRNDLCDVLFWGDFNSPRLIDAARAVGSTSRHPLRLHRGTPTPADDALVKAGQGWITLTSPVEGTSYVTVFAPEVYPWEARTSSAVVHWVDAQWRFPPPANVQAGTRHTLTTTVTRQSDQSPCAGWIVRYEIAGGPDAGFAPDGAACVEVPANPAGQASAEMFQKQPVSGTNRINVQVIRPGGPAAPGQRLVVGTGATMATWTIEGCAPPAIPTTPGIPTTPTTPTPAPKPSTPGAAVLQITAGDPAPVKLGERVTFGMSIVNRGTATAKKLVVKDRFEAGLEHERHTSPIVYDALKDLAPNQTQQVFVTFRATKAGRLCHTVEVTAEGGVRATAGACVTVVGPTGPATPPGPVIPPSGEKPAKPGLRVSIGMRKVTAADARGGADLRTGEVFAAGETVAFQIDVANTGEQALSNVRVVAEYDRSLKATLASEGNKPGVSSLTWIIDRLGPRQAYQFDMHCLCQEAAARSHLRATATSFEGAQAEAEAAVQIRAAGTGFGPGVKPEPGPKTGLPGGGLEMTVDARVQPIPVGKEGLFVIAVVNLDEAPDTSVNLVVTLPEHLLPTPIGTKVEVGPPGIKAHFSGPVVRFDPLPRLAPGRQNAVEYRVRAQAVKPGQATVRAELSSLNQPRPQIVEAKVDVFARD